jgi:hypothetical protein
MRSSALQWANAYRDRLKEQGWIDAPERMSPSSPA